MTKKDYANLLYARRRNIVRVLLGSLVLCALMWTGFHEVLKTGRLLNAPQVMNYLWATAPTSFSAAELKRLMIADGVLLSTYPWLLGLYWGTGVFAIVVAMALITYQIRTHQQFNASYIRGLLGAYKLEEQLINFEREKDKKNLRRLKSSILYSGIVNNVLPFKNRWVITPQFDWFRLASLTGEEHNICAYLAMLNGVMLEALDFRDSMRKFIEPTRILQDFFFAQAQRLDPVLFDPLSLHASSKDSATAERNILSHFVELFEPILAESEKHAVTKPPEEPDSFIERLVKAPLVKHSLIISLIAGIVMAIGLFIFKISTSQAFLTWFTVTFGSLTISVGVTAVAVKSKDSRSEKQHLEE